MPRTATEDVTRLPKWAQSRIEVAERDLAHYKAKLAEGPEDSDTFADPYADMPRPLGRNAHVRFLQDGHDSERRGYDRYIDAKLRRDHQGRSYVEVHAGDTLLVRPSSTNLIHIYLDAR